jgi:hypothetical protein
MLNFIITIFVMLLLGGLALILSNRMETGKKLLASASTIALFYALGTTVYWFFNFFVAVIIMYFYIGSKNIEDVLVKIIVFVAIISLICKWNATKEGFYVSPLRYMSSALTARQCQDACQGSTGCKYAQVPPATSQTGLKNKCWNSYGFNQVTSGGEKQGGDTWLNNLWKPPTKVEGSYNGTISTSGPVFTFRSVQTSMIPKEVSLSVNMRDQGWGNYTDGVYVEGSGPTGIVFKQVIRAPRTSSIVRYPVYKRTSYRVNTTAYRRQSYRKCWKYWLFWTKCKTAWRNVAYNKPVTRYKNVVSRYGSKSVQGSLAGRSQTWQINTNKRITRIKVYAATRGQGHALTANSIRWSIKGWP